jgi:acetyl-CoA carboxylase biotin carboxyl carrier protein
MAARKEQSEPAARASVNMEELRELIALLRDNGLAELELESADFRVRLRREGLASSGDHAHYVQVPFPAPVSLPNTPAATATPSTPVSASTPSGTPTSSAPSADQDLHMITSPIVGTFYRSPSPTAEPFVKIGSNVEASSVVCIIEAMKLMNEIQAEASGEVVKIYVENGQPVEYGQPLFGIKS